jgi:hypothetical protein
MNETKPITIIVQTVYIDGKKARNSYDIELGDQALSDIDEETLNRLIEQLRKVASS